MVKALIDISEDANRILNIVKAKFNLKDKSKAIELIVRRYEEKFLDPGLRTEQYRKAMAAKSSGANVKKVKKRWFYPIFRTSLISSLEIEHPFNFNAHNVPSNSSFFNVLSKTLFAVIYLLSKSNL